MNRLIHVFFFFVISNLFSQSIDYSKFNRSEIKASFIKEISDQSMFIYVDKSYTEAKLDDNISIIENLINFEKEKITNVFRYSFSSNNEKYSIYKFKVRINDTDIKTYTKLYSYRNDIWKEIIDPPKIPKIFLGLFSSMSLSLYRLLISNDNDLKHPEVSKIKTLVINSYGIINIEKLAKVLKENKSSLSKYLDE